MYIVRDVSKISLKKIHFHKFSFKFSFKFSNYQHFICRLAYR